MTYAHRSGLPESAAARRAIERACAGRGGWAIPSPCIAEFWSVVTHPGSSGRPSKPDEAAAFLTALQEAGAKVLYPREGFLERLAGHACDLRVDGPRIFDLQIALVALDGGARQIWSHDANFVSIPGLRVVDPLK